MVKSGSFREDLYYRLNVLSIELPSLKERPDDIIPLAESFLSHFNKKYGLNKVFSQQIKNKMLSYEWPGNVRELKNIVERAVITSESNTLYFPMDILSKQSKAQNNLISSQIEPDGRSFKEQISEYEVKLILSALKLCNGSVAKAAEMLQVHKSILYRKLKSIKFFDGK